MIRRLTGQLRAFRGAIAGLLQRRATPCRWHNLRRVQPLSRVFGLDRGRPVDRYYIERFLAANAASVQGRVLEVGDPAYTRRFGGDRVSRSDVLHFQPGNPSATIVGDLATGEGIPAESFDCFICTQTLQFVYDLRQAVRNSARLLKPGGVMLATVPGISQVSRHDMDRWGEFWRFTSAGVQRLFHEAFGQQVEVTSHGNVLAAVAFLHGVVCEELTAAELDAADPDYELILTVKATRSA